ncbi:MAG: A/G-specific adenine glycosylase [Rothia sp. (in: high G+C Gram-positive bacteria)]|nr:A/G-specific adenine glycosylase [Rothia sp. (in: high G+C Gram-positive bacteria)]
MANTGSDIVLSPEKIAYLHQHINAWYMKNARELPWRAPDRSSWAVMVSEFMLQQTPVKRVLPVWEAWLKRWPQPAALAAEPSAEAVRAWGRLGYPRRALRLHAAATAILDRHQGQVPKSYQELLELPGVGTYTAAAISAFAFGQRSTVIDTNIRRVFARAFLGQALPAKSLTAAESRLAQDLLPQSQEESVTWNAATMELGALICTAKNPACFRCPVQQACLWLQEGRPPASYQPRGQAWAGTDRQLRGAMLAVLRQNRQALPAEVLLRGGQQDLLPDHISPASISSIKELQKLGSSPEQLERCYRSLLKDGLAQEAEGWVSL